MARGRKKVSTDSLDAKIENQKAVMEKAKLKYEAEKEALAELIKLRNELRKDELSYDMECEPEEWEALQLERYINQERNPELREALEDLDEFLFG